MDAEYWLQRWREGRTGWHHRDVMPLLVQHWPTLGVAAGARVLVPLCGKSLDMGWLASQGLQVLGVDVSPIALDAFLAEHHLQATPRAERDATVRDATGLARGAIRLLQGDIFRVSPARFAACTAFYDRAATIALPAELRTRLANEVYGRMPAGAHGLLITLEYHGGRIEPPPFSVDDAEVQRMFAAHWDIARLERRDILASQPMFRDQGVASLHTAVYALTRRAD